MFDVKVSRGDDYETQQEGKVSRLRVVGFFSQQGAELRGRNIFCEFCVFLTPDLENAGALHTGLRIQVKCIKDQGLFLCVEDAAKRLAGATAAIHVENVSYIKLACAHEFADVAVRSKKAVRIGDLLLQTAIAGD